MKERFKNKQIMVFGSGAGVIQAASWLLDQGARVTITDPEGVRRVQGHLRTVASDGKEYERRKSRLVLVADDDAQGLVATADLVVAHSGMASVHPIVRHAHEHGVPVVNRAILAKIPPLPPRQEVAHRSEKLTIVNDTGAIWPQRSMVAIRQWGAPNCILIAGGGGRAHYAEWADTVTRHIRPTNTILLAGTATQGMRKALGRASGIRTYETLSRAWRAALDRAGKYVSAVILYAPGAVAHDGFSALVKKEFT